MFFDLDHLKKNNITYWDHLERALGFTALAAISVPMFFIHAIIPYVFATTGSDCLKLIINVVDGKIKNEKDTDS